MGQAFAALDGRRIAGDGGQLDHCALCLEDRRGGFALQLRQAGIHGTDGDAGAGGRRGVDAFFCEPVGEGEPLEFAGAVADSVSRVACLGLLVGSAMVVLGEPAIDLVFTGGRFSAADSQTCAAYFAVFSLSVFLWSAQAIYSRAFFAAGNTFTPMVAGTVVTAASLPIYTVLFHVYGAMGLAASSDLGIAMQTLTIAYLLHRRRMVSLASLDYGELGRCALAAVVSGTAVWGLFDWLGGRVMKNWFIQGAAHRRTMDLILLLGGTLLWAVLTDWLLRKTGSALPRVARKRLGLAGA